MNPKPVPNTPAVNPMFAKFDQVLGVTTPTLPHAPAQSRADEILAIGKAAKEEQIRNTPEPSFGSRVGSDVTSASSRVNDAISGTGDYQGKSTLNRATGAVSEAVTGVAKTAGELLPQSVRGGIDTVGKTTGGVLNFLGDKIGNIKALQDWTQKHPQATADLEDIAGTASNLGNISGNILAAGGGAKVGQAAIDVAPKVAEGAINVGSKVGDALKLNPTEVGKGIVNNDTLEIVKPKLTVKESAKALAEGRGDKGGILSKTTIAPSPRTLDVAKAVEGLVKKGATGAENINNVRTALNSEAESLKSQIKAVDHPYSFRELNTSLSKVIQDPDLISLKGTQFEKQIGPVKDAAMRFAKESGGKVSGLLDARKAFDNLVEKTYPHLYDVTNAPMRTAITGIRNAMNDFIENNLPDNLSFKSSLKKQSLMYDAIENIADKSTGEIGTSKVGRVIKSVKKHPIATAAGTLVANKIIKGTTGLGF